MEYISIFRDDVCCHARDKFDCPDKKFGKNNKGWVCHNDILSGHNVGLGFPDGMTVCPEERCA